MARAFASLKLGCLAAGFLIVAADAASAQATNGNRATTSGVATPRDVETWQLVRTPNPRGPATVAILQEADRARSDGNLAGLTLRCTETGFDVAVVVVPPFPPGSHPKVKLAAAPAPSTVEFDATVASPGGAIRLPNEAAALLRGPWKSESELGVEVAENGATVRGVVPLAGLDPAVARLMANCPTRWEWALNRRLLPGAAQPVSPH